MTTRLKQKFMALAMLIIFIIQSLGMVVMPVMRAQAQAGPVQLDVSVEEGESESELTLHSTFRQGQASVEDKALQLSLPSDYYQLQDLHYHDPTRQQWLAIPITTDRSAYQKQWQAYQAYLDDLDAYEEDLANYEQDLVAYQEGVNHLQALKQAQAEAEYLAQEATAATQAEAQVIDEEAEGKEGLAEEAAEPQVPAPPAPDLPDYSEEIQTLEEHLEEPVAPTDPTDPAKDKLWLIAYQPAADQESYQLHLPDDLQAGQLKWQAQQTKEADQKLQAQLTLDYQINKQAQQIKEKIDLPAIEAPASESEAEDDTDSSTDEEDEGEEDPQSDEESEEDSKDTAGDHPLPQVDQPLVLHMFERVEAAEVVQNVEDFDPGTTFSWEKAPMTWWPGERTAILQINHADGTTDQMEIDIQVTTALPRPDNEGEKIDEDTAFRQSQADGGVLQLKKVDVHFRPLAGAGFRLYGISYDNQDYDQIQGVEQNKTDFTFEGLKEGQYILDEINTPPGYDRLSDRWQVGVSRNSQGEYEVSVSGKNAIQSDESHVYIMNTQGRLHNVTFKKVDAYSKKPVRGVVFELYRQRPNGDRLPVGERGTTDEQGEFHFRNLPEGTYYLRDLFTPRRYIKEENLIGPFAVPNLSGEAYVVEKEPFVETITHFTFTYRDQKTRNPITTGGEFQLKNSKGQVIDTAKALSTNGAVQFVNQLQVGEYTIEQTQPAPGYQLMTAPIHLQVAPGQQVGTGTGSGIGGIFLNVKATGGDNFVPDRNDYHFYAPPTQLKVKHANLKGEPIQGPVAGGDFELLNERQRPLNPRIRTQSQLDGSIIFEYLKPGTYYIRQNYEGGPNGTEGEYNVDYNDSGLGRRRNIYGPYTVHEDGSIEIPSGQDVIYNRIFKPNQITFRKVDAETGEPIPGVRFQVYRGPAGNRKTDQIVVSDENGIVTYEPDHDWTHLEEIQAAPGYKKRPEKIGPWRRYISSGNIEMQGNAYLQIHNEPLKIDLSLTKEDPSGTPIPGAVFELTRKEDSNYRQVIESGQDGRVYGRNLRMGTYTLREIQVPPGFNETNRTSTFKIEADGTSGQLRLTGLTGDLIEQDPQNPNNYRIVNTRERYGFFKQDENGNPIEGVQFNMVNNDSKYSDRIKISQSNGFVSLSALSNYPNTSWTLSEGTVPAGYQSTDQTWTFLVNQYGEVEKVPLAGEHFFSEGNMVVDDLDQNKVLKNRKLTEDLIFYKKGANQVRLGGAEFSLEQVERLDDGTYQTMNGGIKQTDRTDFIGADNRNATPIHFEDLPEGFYRIKETKTPEGYVETPDAYSIVEMRFVATENRLHPVIVEGSLLSHDSDVGTYAPNALDSTFGFTKYGYVDSDEPEEGQIIEAINSTRRVQPISGVSFELKSITEGLDYEQTIISDGTGRVAFPDLELKEGRYQLRETQAPANYRKSDAVYDIEVKIDPVQGFTYKITKAQGDDEFLLKDSNHRYALDYAINELNPVEVAFKKVSDKGEPLKDATFTIQRFDLDSNTSYGDPIATAQSDDQGRVSFKNLAPGEYALFETLPPINYQMADDFKGRFKVTEDYQVVWHQADSQPADAWDFTSGDVPKVKNSFNPLDLIFHLYDRRSASQADSVSEMAGFGQPIQGSTFKLTKYAGHPNDAGVSLSTNPEDTWTATSDENGKIFFDFGTYTPNRDIAGDGYVYFRLEQENIGNQYEMNIPAHTIRLKRDNTFDIVADDFGKLERGRSLIISPQFGYIYFNNPLSIDLTFNLVDGHTGTDLAGSRFRLYSKEKNSDDQPIYDQTYSQQGASQLYFSNLTAGTYYIEQLDAPEGYAKLPKPVELEVSVKEKNQSLQKALKSSDLYAEYVDRNGDGNANELIIKNYPVATFPNTGGQGPWIFLTVGLIFLVMSYLLYCYGQRLQATERGDP